MPYEPDRKPRPMPLRPRRQTVLLLLVLLLSSALMYLDAVLRFAPRGTW